MKKPGPHSRAIAHRNSLIEHLAAKGLMLTQISELVGLSTKTISTLLKTPESIVRVEDINAQIRAQLVSEAANIGDKFDQEAPEAFECLKRLNRGETDDVGNPVPHAVRLQASTQILDRAPSVPVKKSDGDSAKHLHIHLPEKQFQNAQQALLDVGVVVDMEREPDE